jgi:hypothetical protein
LLVASLFLSGCAGTGALPGGPPEDLPGQWQGALRAESGPWAVWGYGTEAERDSVVASRQGADSAARADLAERAGNRVTRLREMLVERMAGEGEEGLSPEAVGQALKRAREIAVNESVIVRREREADGTWHALARGELETGLREGARARLEPEQAKRLMEAAGAILAEGSPAQNGEESGDEGE